MVDGSVVRSCPKQHPKARQFVVNCDDLGLHPTINDAIVDLLSGGVVRSASILATGPSYEHAVNLLKQQDIETIGLHLCVQAEFEALPMRPTCGNRVPSLTRPDGVFFSKIDDVLRDINYDQLEKELKAQIDCVIHAGFRISHLDGHMFFYEEAGNAEVLSIVERLSRDYGVPMRRMFCDAPATKVHFIWGGYESIHQRHRYYDDLFKYGTDPICEVIIHPGKLVKELRQFTSVPVRRLADYLYFRDFDASWLEQYYAQISGWHDLSSNT